MSDDTADDQIAIQRAAMGGDPAVVYTHDCNTAFKRGRERFGDEDFIAAIDSLKDTGCRDDHVLKQIMGADDPSGLLYKLSQDPETAKTVAAMSDVRRAEALAALARDEPLPSANRIPSYKRSRTDLSREDVSDRDWGKAWDRKYLGKGR
jgi:hypothetical protein